MIIDTHCHFDMMLNPNAYIREKEASKNIVIGMTNLPSHFQMGQPYVRHFKYIRLALGLHPLLAANNKVELPLFKRLIGETSYIGEIGLDFSKEGHATKDDQIIVFKEILSTIKGKKKIVSVHSRSAEKDILSLLSEYNIENVIFHWYSGPENLIHNILDQGYYFSVNEAMCLSSNGQTIIKKIPHERIVTETDAPYNNKCSIKNALAYLKMTEQEIHVNYFRLLSSLKSNGFE